MWHVASWTPRRWEWVEEDGSRWTSATPRHADCVGNRIWGDMVAAMTANVNGVIRYLRDVGLEEAQLVDDVELNRLLDPYRAVYPIPYKCQKERCKTTLAYWAIHSTGARIAPAPSRVDRKGVRAGTQPRAPTYRPGRPQPPSEVIVGGTADLPIPRPRLQRQIRRTNRMGTQRRRNHQPRNQPNRRVTLAAPLEVHLPPLQQPIHPHQH